MIVGTSDRAALRVDCTEERHVAVGATDPNLVRRASFAHEVAVQNENARNHDGLVVARSRFTQAQPKFVLSTWRPP